MKLKTKLISLFIVFISIPLIILSTFSYAKTYKSIQSVTEEHLDQTATYTANAIKASMNSVENTVRIISNDEDLISFSFGDINLNSRITKYINNIQMDNKDLIETIFIVNTSGKCIASTSSAYLNLKMNEREYIKECLSKGSAFQSDVIFSKSTGQPIIGIAQPLISHGKIVGSVIGTIKFKNISLAASKVKIGKKGYAYLINKEGTYLYHPNSKNILKENISNTNDPKLKALVQEMLSGKDGQGYYTTKGVRKFVQFTPVNSWCLVVTSDYKEYMSSAISIRNSAITIALISLTIAIILCSLITTKNLINPIKALESLMLKSGDGDLTVRADINTKDEIQTLGEYFNKMLSHQREIIDHIRKSSEELAESSEDTSSAAEEISSATEEISASIQEVASNAEKQNLSIVETSKVLVQLSSLVQMAQSKAIKTKENSHHSMETAQDGRVKVKETMAAINAISLSSKETANMLVVLDDLSKKVSGIITTINSISEQTNLLALNAAIEAARAGEHGKGFTVVADEVRKLSEETSTGANEISELVGKMVLQISGAVESMKSCENTINNGVLIANDTDKSFVTIISSVEQIGHDIDQVVSITKDEVASSDEIIKLIDSIATLAETTTAHSEEVSASSEEQGSLTETLAASSEEISAMATSLNNLIEKFIV